MLRRLKFFLAGALLSILVLSMGPENRLKDTFIAYIEYFDPDKRIIRQLVISDSIQISSEANIKLLSEVYHGIDYSLNHDTFNIQQVENYLDTLRKFSNDKSESRFVARQLLEMRPVPFSGRLDNCRYTSVAQ